MCAQQCEVLFAPGFMRKVWFRIGRTKSHVLILQKVKFAINMSLYYYLLYRVLSATASIWYCVELHVGAALYSHIDVRSRHSEKDPARMSKIRAKRVPFFSFSRFPKMKINARASSKLIGENVRGIICTGCCLHTFRTTWSPDSLPIFEFPIAISIFRKPGKNGTKTASLRTSLRSGTCVWFSALRLCLFAVRLFAVCGTLRLLPGPAGY